MYVSVTRWSLIPATYISLAVKFHNFNDLIFTSQQCFVCFYFYFLFFFWGGVLFLFVVFCLLCGVFFLGGGGLSIRSWCNGLSDRSLMVNLVSYISFQTVLHNWCNKGCGVCFPACGVVHIKYPLLLIGKKEAVVVAAGFLSRLPEWSFTICPTPHNRKIKCVECIFK